MFDAPKEKFRLLPNIQKCKHCLNRERYNLYHDIMICSQLKEIRENVREKRR